MNARIHNISTGAAYEVASVHECRDETDKSAYRECAKSNDVITMGTVIAEPIKEDKSMTIVGTAEGFGSGWSQTFIRGERENRLAFRAACKGRVHRGYEDEFSVEFVTDVNPDDFGVEVKTIYWPPAGLDARGRAKREGWVEMNLTPGF